MLVKVEDLIKDKEHCKPNFPKRYAKYGLFYVWDYDDLIVSSYSTELMIPSGGGGHICSGINPIVTKTDQRYHANILFDYVSCQQDVKEPYDVLPIKDIFRCFCFVLYYKNLI